MRVLAQLLSRASTSGFFLRSDRTECFPTVKIIAVIAPAIHVIAIFYPQPVSRHASWTGPSVPSPVNSSSLARTLWRFKIKSVDLLGADIAHQKRRPIRSETAPRQPCIYNATEILQVGDPFQFTICDANTVDRRIRTKTSIEVDVFAIGRPLCEANSCTGQL